MNNRENIPSLYELSQLPLNEWYELSVDRPDVSVKNGGGFIFFQVEASEPSSEFSPFKFRVSVNESQLEEAWQAGCETLLSFERFKIRNLAFGEEAILSLKNKISTLEIDYAGEMEKLMELEDLSKTLNHKREELVLLHSQLEENATGLMQLGINDNALKSYFIYLKNEAKKITAELAIIQSQFSWIDKKTAQLNHSLKKMADRYEILNKQLQYYASEKFTRLNIGGQITIYPDKKAKAENIFNSLQELEEKYEEKGIAPGTQPNSDRFFNRIFSGRVDQKDGKYFAFNQYDNATLQRMNDSDELANEVGEMFAAAELTTQFEDAPVEVNSIEMHAAAELTTQFEDAPVEVNPIETHAIRSDFNFALEDNHPDTQPEYVELTSPGSFGLFNPGTLPELTDFQNNSEFRFDSMAPP